MSSFHVTFVSDSLTSVKRKNWTGACINKAHIQLVSKSLWRLIRSVLVYGPEFIYTRISDILPAGTNCAFAQRDSAD